MRNVENEAIFYLTNYALIIFIRVASFLPTTTYLFYLTVSIFEEEEKGHHSITIDYVLSRYSQSPSYSFHAD